MDAHATRGLVKEGMSGKETHSDGERNVDVKDTAIYMTFYRTCALFDEALIVIDLRWTPFVLIDCELVCISRSGAAKDVIGIVPRSCRRLA